jgi:hypothetical protein
MKKIRVVSVFIFFLFSNVGFSQNRSYDSCITRLSAPDCISLLAQYSDAWINDSLAKNGFRHFFGWEIFRCSGKNLRGQQWTVIAKYLGKPHYTIRANAKNPINSKDEFIYRYVLFTWSGNYQDYRDLGNKFLDVIVVNGIIRFCGVQENDG